MIGGRGNAGKQWLQQDADDAFVEIFLRNHICTLQVPPIVV